MFIFTSSLTLCLLDVQHFAAVSAHVDFSGLNIGGIIWDNVSTQLNNIWKKDRAACQSFIAEMWHIISSDLFWSGKTLPYFMRKTKKAKQT